MTVDPAEALRHHHASPIEKIDIEIERLQRQVVAKRMLGDREALVELTNEMTELHRRKAELEVAGEAVERPNSAQGAA